LASYRTSGRRSLFTYRNDEVVFANGASSRIIPQGYWYAGPFGLMAEYVRSSQVLDTDSLSATVHHASWQVTAVYALTGEDATYSRLVPRHPAGDAGRLGAVELVARVHGYTFDRAVFPDFANPADAVASATAWTIGVNWYFHTNIRFMIHYEETAFEAAAAGSRRPTERAILTRFQLAF
jgi:phosphate-selective porin OprO/OprP